MTRPIGYLERKKTSCERVRLPEQNRVKLSERQRTPRAVSHFLEQVIETGSVGLDREIIFRKVVKGEPGFSLGTPNPFTGRTERKRLSTRTMRHSERLTDTFQIVGLAETEQEYDVSVVSRARPAIPPLDIGRPDAGNGWRRWEGAYYLEIRCRVRDSLADAFLRWVGDRGG